MHCFNSVKKDETCYCLPVSFVYYCCYYYYWIFVFIAVCILCNSQFLWCEKPHYEYTSVRWFVVRSANAEAKRLRLKALVLRRRRGKLHIGLTNIWFFCRSRQSNALLTFVNRQVRVTCVVVITVCRRDSNNFQYELMCWHTIKIITHINTI